LARLDRVRKPASFFVRGAGRPRPGTNTTTFQQDGDEAGDKGVWMSVWVDDVDAMHKHCVAAGLEGHISPTDMPWNVREMHLRHPDGHVFRVSADSSINNERLWKSAIRQQFHAAIDMLANAIHACPDSVWSGQPPRAFWYIAFHALFFLDLYLSPVGEAEFRPPAPFGLTELADGVPPERAYTKNELLAYLDHCRKKLDAVMASMTEEWPSLPVRSTIVPWATENCSSTTCGMCNITRRN